MEATPVTPVSMAPETTADPMARTSSATSARSERMSARMSGMMSGMLSGRTSMSRGSVGRESGRHSSSASSRLSSLLSSTASQQNQRPHVREPDLSRKVVGTELLRAEKAARAEMVKKLNFGLFVHIEMEDVQEFLDLMAPPEMHSTDGIPPGQEPAKSSTDESGPVTFELLEILLVGMCDPALVDEEVKVVDDNLRHCVDGTVSRETLFEAVTTGAIRQILLLLRHIPQSDSIIMRRIVPVDRILLEEVVEGQVRRSDAFGTLLFALLYLAILVFLVLSNLRCYGRFQVEDSMEEYIEHFGASLNGPFLKSHVVDINSYWTWLNTSGLQAFYGTNSHRDGREQFLLANQHSLIGDVKITHILPNTSRRNEWILSSDEGQRRLRTNPGDHLSAAFHVISKLYETEPWSAADTDAIQVVFCTFNTYDNYFTSNNVNTQFMPSGIVRSTINSRSHPITENINAEVWAANILYGVAVCWLFFREGLDLFRASRLGPKEFFDYWNFWNTLDWASIICAIVNCILWSLLQIALRADPLPNLLKDPHLMSRDVQFLESMVRALENVHDKLLRVQWMLIVTMVFTLGKLFKGYRANPRLQIVSNTISRSFLDILHFFLVFFTIFFCFAFVGHIFFGADVHEFSSVWNAFYTCFSTLMGEFEWYIAISMTYEDHFPSGIPRAAMTFWFITFILCVLLVLLNMLMAILMQEYSKIMAGMVDRIDAESLGVQAWDHLTRFRWQRGWYPLSKVLLELQNDYAPAHPELLVSEESLTNAFPDIPYEQACWLMNKMLENACHNGMRAISADELMYAHTERAVKSLTTSLNVVSKQTDARLQQLEKLLLDVKEAADADTKYSVANGTTEADSDGQEAREESWNRELAL